MEMLQLRYFRELAKSQHLSKTAERLHVAQPSLSQTLKRLETELGVPLFDRVGKRIVLNQYGRIFLKYTEEVFASLDNARLELDVARQAEEKTVALYIHAASMLLPELMSQIYKKDEAIRLKIFQRVGEVEQSMPSLYLTASCVCPESNCSVVLLKEAIKLAVPTDHPLAKKDEITAADLADESFLSLTPSSDLAGILSFYCEQYDFCPNISTYVDSPAAMRDLLRAKLGIAFVPACTWKGFGENTVVLKEVKHKPMERYLLLSWDPGSYETPAFSLCKETIVEYFNKYSLQCQEAEEM